jgi:hypothetical protein
MGGRECERFLALFPMFNLWVTGICPSFSHVSSITVGVLLNKGAAWIYTCSECVGFEPTKEGSYIGFEGTFGSFYPMPLIVTRNSLVIYERTGRTRVKVKRS